jgi:hypothetical protein
VGGAQGDLDRGEAEVLSVGPHQPAQVAERQALEID